MATKLDQEFVAKIRLNQANAMYGLDTLVREVERLEAYCEALESKLTPEKIAEASREAVEKP